MKLKNYNKEQLELIISGALNFYQFLDGFDNTQRLEFDVIEAENYFKIYYGYIIYVKEKSVLTHDGLIEDDGYTEIETSYFRIHKNESMRKLMKELYDIMYEVFNKKID